MRQGGRRHPGPGLAGPPPLELTASAAVVAPELWTRPGPRLAVVREEH